MTMGYQSTYGTFYNLSIIVSDFISMISLEDKVKSGQKLYLFEKKKKTCKTKKSYGQSSDSGNNWEGGNSTYTLLCKTDD